MVTFLKDSEDVLEVICKTFKLYNIIYIAQKEKGGDWMVRYESDYGKVSKKIRK